MTNSACEAAAYLAHDNASSLQVPIQHRDAQHGIGVASCDRQRVQCGQQRGGRRVVGIGGVHVLPPGALVRGDFLQHILA